MFGKHVSKLASAYCHGELLPEESRRVAEHLIGCNRCRAEFEEIKLGVKFAEQLPEVSAPPSMWSEIETALSARSNPIRSGAAHFRRSFTFNWQTATAICAALILVIGAFWFLRHQRTRATEVASTEKQTTTRDSTAGVNQSEKESQSDAAPKQPSANRIDNPAEVAPNTRTPGPSWEVARLEGSPTVGANRIESTGRLAVGEWLETDGSSRAQINVANIGRVNVEPNSRVRLVNTSATEHRLAMTRGRLHATISAPPRLFIVETPSGVAVDLGCSYTLEVDKAGRSVLHVTTGWVELGLEGRASIVPAGAVCVTEPGKGPGTPYFNDASDRFRGALTRLDFQNGGAQALSTVLGEARESDTLTLWHLLSRVRGAERERVYDRMAALVAPPQGVTRLGVLRLDRSMLDRWKDVLERAWFD